MIPTLTAPHPAPPLPANLCITRIFLNNPRTKGELDLTDSFCVREGLQWAIASFQTSLDLLYKSHLKAIADKYGIVIPKAACKRASWHEAIKTHPESSPFPN
jgi:hypothetical protein